MQPERTSQQDESTNGVRSAVIGLVVTSAVLVAAVLADRVVSSAWTASTDNPRGEAGDAWAVGLIVSNLVGLALLGVSVVKGASSTADPRAAAGSGSRGTDRSTAMLRALGVVPVPVRTLIVWTAVFLVASVVGEGALQLMGLPADAAPLMRAYDGAASFWLLAVAVALTAPVFEELLLRGFLFGRLEASPLGSGGAVLVTASIWTLLHFQYSVGAFVFVAVLALVFSAARARTGSVWPSLFLHVLNNVGLLLQTIVWAR